MSTRGAVAFGTENEWRGIYNHSESMPTMLGPRVWALVSGKHANGAALADLRTQLFAAGDVGAFLERKVSHEPLELSSASAHPLHISYVYVVDAATSTLHVLRGDPRAEVIPSDPRALLEADAWHYVRLDSYSLTGPEPDWSACGRAWREKNCERHIRPIVERFGDSAGAAARRQWLAE